MKYLKNISEAGKYNREEDRFMFNPSEFNNTITFYLHDDKNKKGFAMDIAIHDKEKMEQLLNKNNITFTLGDGPDLPF